MKKAARILAILLSAALLAGCGTAAGSQSSQTSQSSEPQASEKVLRAGSLGNFGATNLDCADDWNGWFLSFFGVAETLFKQSNAYEAVPTLVESFEEPADGVTWKFTLRDDVYFSNGEKMTAQSVVDCFNRTFAENPRGSETLRVSDMSADGQVLTLVTQEPDPTFLYTLCDPILTVYYVGEGIDYDAQCFCTGPFVVDEFTREDLCIVKKNDNYWGGAPKIDRAYLKTFTDEDSMVLAMQNGELDHIDGTAGALLLCNESTGFNVLSADTSRAEWITFNYNESSYAQDPVIRKVIALAVDREGYEKISEGTKKANYGIYPNALAYGDNSKLDIHITKKDLDEAVRVLDEAGYSDTDGDGFREIDGTPISLKLVTYTSLGSSGAQELCDVLASDLRSIGIQMKTETYENLDSFETFEGVTWDLFINGKYMTPTGSASYFFDQDVVTGGSTNYGGYSNPEIDALAAQLHATFGEEERDALTFQMEQILLDDNSYIVYTNGTNTYITSPRLTGYVPNPSNYYFMDENMDLTE